jgi:hypothetical protein
MFRRLAQLTSDNRTPEGFSVDRIQGQYNAQQSMRYNNILPNAIPTASAFPAPQAVGAAVATADPYLDRMIGRTEADRLFLPNTIPDNLVQQNTICAQSTIDQLISSQDPSRPIRCGWVYTPPTAGSPFPQVSAGVLGTGNGPFSFFAPASYQKWYWDLGAAKKQMLVDRCKTLKNCTDVANDPYAGSCGYCSDIGQGIPIDSNGVALYTDNSLTNCSPGSIIGTASACPAPGSGAGPGAAPQVGVCTPDGSGRLGVTCLESLIETGGCSDAGALAVALSSGATPGDYMAGARQLNSMTIYNQRAAAPFNINMYSQGQTTVAAALQEVRNLASTAKVSPAGSALNFAARDLCLQKGIIDQFDFCTELSPNTPPPYDVSCLQKAFLAAGGQPAGSQWPTATNLSYYNSFGSWQAVLSYFNSLAQQARGLVIEGFNGITDIVGQTRTNYQTQATALMALRGITPDQLTNRAPYYPGVEVIWMNSQTGIILNCTIENGFPVLNGAIGDVLPQSGLDQFNMMYAITDIRMSQDTQLKFQVFVDDGFVLAKNNLFRNGSNLNYSADEDGLFAANFVQGGTLYQANNCWSMNGTQANIVKLFYNDAGGSHALNIQVAGCNGGSYSPVPGVSLTRELSAPFIAFENLVTGGFADIRIYECLNFAIYGNSFNNLIVMTDGASALQSPNGRGWTRMNSGASNLVLRNLAWNAWSAFSFVFRINTMPVNDFLFSMGSGGASVAVFLSPINGGTAVVNYYSTLGGSNPSTGVRTGIQLSQNIWYYCLVMKDTAGTMLTCSFMDLTSVQGRADAWFASGNSSTSFTTSNNGIPISTTPTNSVLQMGTGSNIAMLSWDILSWHIWGQGQGPVNGLTIQRDAKYDWRLTLPIGL